MTDKEKNSTKYLTNSKGEYILNKDGSRRKKPGRPKNSELSNIKLALQAKNKLDKKVDFDNDSKYEGKQVFLNTDRIVFNAKEHGKKGGGQFICYSKSWQYFNTDNRFMVDSGKGTTLETQGDTEIVSKQLISLKTD